MNTIKMSTKQQAGRQDRLFINLNLESSTINWNPGDIIRIISKKKENKIVLQRVFTKAKKTVAHTLTQKGSSFGIFMNYGARRFKNKFAKAHSIEASFQLNTPNHSKIEITLPDDIFKQ